MQIYLSFIAKHLLLKSADLVFILDKKLNVVFCNESFLKFHDVLEKDIIGLNLDHLFNLGLTNYYINSEQNEIPKGKFSFEESFLDQSNIKRYFNTTVEDLVFNKEDNFIVFVSYDTTSEINYLTVLGNNKKVLKTLNGGLFHDIKQPIRIVKSFSHLLLKESNFELNNQIKEYINHIIENSDKLDEYIAGLSSYLATSTYDFDFTETVNLNNMLDQIVTVELKSFEFSCEKDILPTIIGNSNCLKKLFYHLILNAIQHNDKAIKEVKITVNQFNGKTRFAISDNGIGISSKYFVEIFELLYTVKKGDYTGNGFGLTFAKRITELHQANIWVESEVGKGSTFFVEFDNWRVLTA